MYRSIDSNYPDNKPVHYKPPVAWSYEVYERDTESTWHLKISLLRGFLVSFLHLLQAIRINNIFQPGRYLQ